MTIKSGYILGPPHFLTLLLGWAWDHRRSRLHNSSLGYPELYIHIYIYIQLYIIYIYKIVYIIYIYI